MPVLSAPLEPEGALVDVRVGWSAPSIQAQRRALRPIPPAREVRALLDTGAEVTCLDWSVIQSAGLPLDGMTLANLPAAGGLTLGAQYRAGLTIVHPSGDASRNWLVSDLAVIGLALGPLGYQVLIGRDVLAGCKFLYNGPRSLFQLYY